MPASRRPARSSAPPGSRSTLSWDHSGRGAFSVSQGWFANAERLLEGQPESVEHGFLTLTRAVNTLFGGGKPHRGGCGLRARAASSASASATATSQALALVGKGRALVKGGEIEQGFALLDEATAAAVCGELRPYATGLVYCITISSCQDLGDYRRAAEWTEAANRWCDRLDVSGFPGACRIHRAEIMRLRGDWPGPRSRRSTACEELHDFDRSHHRRRLLRDRRDPSPPGRLRRRGGGVRQRERARARPATGSRAPSPRRGQGRRARSRGSSARSRDVDDPLSRLRRLPAQIEIAIAAGDLKTARAAADELERIVDSYKIGGRRAPAFDATVHFASGQIKLAEGDSEGASAVPAAQRATSGRRSARRTRPRRHGCCSASPSGARATSTRATAELEAALATFERLGAKLDEERAKELLGRPRRGARSSSPTSSTRRKLLETLGDEKWRKLLARHDELLRERIVESGGEVIKQTGDGFFAAFDNPKAAIEAAVAIQRALDAEIVAPDVRIGAHTGGAFQTDAGFTRLRRRGRTRRGANRRGGGRRRDPGQPRDARRRRDRVPPVRAPRRAAQGLRAADRRSLRRLALADCCRQLAPQPNEERLEGEPGL